MPSSSPVAPQVARRGQLGKQGLHVAHGRLVLRVVREKRGLRGRLASRRGRRLVECSSFSVDRPRLLGQCAPVFNANDCIRFFGSEYLVEGFGRSRNKMIGKREKSCKTEARVACTPRLT